jgi:hypothetical protein
LTADRPGKRVDFRIDWTCGCLKDMQHDFDAMLPHFDWVAICADLE